MQLSPEQGRVIGSLVEKQLTTPQQYPLTLNALVLACNQASDRDPVVDYDERTVDGALTSLKAAGLVSFVHPSHGRSVTRYHQLLGERLALGEQQQALVAVLLLRGPQTGAELRARTDRMCEFDGIAEVEQQLDELRGLPEPVVARLPRRPGQKEERWAQLLTSASAERPSEAPGDVRRAAFDGAHPTVSSAATTADAELRGGTLEVRGAATGARGEMAEPRGGTVEVRGEPAGAPGEVAELRETVAELRGEMAELRGEMAELHGEMAELRGEMAELRGGLEALRRDLYG
ncbi:MAG TPA: DUF480 domain-containing protein [Acidimicrobiales bacterium]|nr:DUF480 domain-containing protein [Acidimicrobiales bacterium]